MPLTSSYPTIAAQLVSLLQAALPGVEVYRGVKIDRLPADFVAVGGVEDGTHVIPTMKVGRKRRQEDYHLIVNVVSVRGGADPTDAETRVFELLGAMEDELADDPSLGLGTTADLVGLVCTMSEFSLDSVYDAQRNGWRAMIVAKVLVTVRLQ